MLGHVTQWTQRWLRRRLAVRRQPWHLAKRSPISSPSWYRSQFKFISANLNHSFLQAALSISCNFLAVFRSKKSSWWPNCSLTQFLPETTFPKLGNNIMTCLWNQKKINKGSKSMSCNIWFNFNRGISTMLGNYIVVRDCGTIRSWRSNEIRQRTCRDSLNKIKCAVVEFKKSNVFNDSWKFHWNFSLKISDFQLSAAAPFTALAGYTFVPRNTDREVLLWSIQK